VREQKLLSQSVCVRACLSEGFVNIEKSKSEQVEAIRFWLAPTAEREGMREQEVV
jgi:hypothetical protein